VAVVTRPAVVREIPALPRRDAAAHKGTFGTVRVFAGSPGMLGAAILCARAALRGGAGLVQVSLPASLAVGFAVAVPGATTLPRRVTPSLLRGATAVVVGPGLGQADASRTLVRAILRTATVPVVLDADGLNLVAPARRALSAAPTVATPHPGEAARLLGWPRDRVQEDRDGAVAALAEVCGGVAVLKGAGTKVCDGARLFTNTTGNPGMATGGSGDVLAGLIGALLAQGMAPFDAAVLGVHAHGRAGDVVAGRTSQTGLIAEDLPDALAEVLAP